MKKSGRSIHRFVVALAAFVLWSLTATIASATPSTQIWIPSTDIQPYKTVHLNIDSFIRTGKEPNSNTGYFGIPDGGNLPPLYDFGPTVGILPFEKIQAEVGFDLVYGGANTPAGLDKYPIYGNFKIGMPEDNTWIPAVAVQTASGRRAGRSTTASTRRPARTRASTTAWSPRRSPSWGGSPWAGTG